MNEDATKEKRALVLSGGGCKGAFQVGVLRALIDEENLDYDIYVGISVGALNVSLLAAGPLNEMLATLESVWLKEVKGNSSIWNHHLWKKILIGIIVILTFVFAGFISFIFTTPKWITIILFLLALGAFYLPYNSLSKSHSVYTTEPLREILDKYLDLRQLRDGDKLLRIGAVSYETLEYYVATEKHREIKDWIMASSAFPIFFPMPEIEGQHWWDGGVLNVAPLQDAIDAGATHIDIILADPLRPGKQSKIPGILGQIIRALDALSSEILVNDIRIKCNRHAHLKVRVFMPLEDLSEDALEFNPEKIVEMYNKGKEKQYKIMTYNQD